MVPELVDGQDALQHHARLAVGEARHHQARAVAQRHVSRQLQRLEMLCLARTEAVSSFSSKLSSSTLLTLLFKLRNFLHIFLYWRAEHERVSAVHDLNYKVAPLNDPPQLSPELQVLVVRSHDAFSVLLQRGQSLSPLQEALVLQLLVNRSFITFPVTQSLFYFGSFLLLVHLTPSP